MTNDQGSPLVAEQAANLPYFDPEMRASASKNDPRMGYQGNAGAIEYCWAEITNMDLERARDQFPGLEDKVFLDAACVSLAPRVAGQAIHEFLDMALRCPQRSATQYHIALDAARDEARSQAARLINAGADEIALVESTTHGLGLAAQAIPLNSGDRVLLCDLEFMEVAIPWRQLRARGIEMDVVRNCNGRLRIEDIADSITAKTAVVAVSSVQWSNGFRCDLAALSALCRDRKLWLVVDAVQQLGAIPLDVRQTPVDFLACGGHKWLNAPFGAGFLYIKRESLPRLRPPLAGYLSVQEPEGGWEEYFQTPSITPVQDYRFTQQARLYEIGGTSNYPGAVGLAASLRLIQELGPARIQEHIHQLTDRLISGLLQALGVKLVTPVDREDREHRAGIVTFTAGSAGENRRVMERLLDRRILVSVRYTSQVGGVRVSCHFYNNAADVDRLLETVAQCV